MKRLVPLAAVVALFVGGCSPSAAPSPATASASASPSPAALSATELRDAALVADDTLAKSGELKVVRQFDVDELPEAPVGVVTACDGRAASSKADGDQVKAHFRGWTMENWIVTQYVYVLPNERAEDVVATVASLLKACKTYRKNRVTITRTADPKLGLQASLTRAATICFTASGRVECMAYLGRGSVVSVLYAHGPDHESAEFLLDVLTRAAWDKLVRLPA